MVLVFKNDNVNRSYIILKTIFTFKAAIKANEKSHNNYGNL